MGGLADALNKAKQALTEVTKEDGETTVLGRRVRYEWEGYMYRWELHYKAAVVDIATGLTGKAKNYLSRYTSLRYAIKNLLGQLGERGRNLTVGAENKFCVLFCLPCA